MYYPIKILDTTFSTHLHTNGPFINALVNLTFTETFVNTTLKFRGLNFSVNLTGPLINGCFMNKVPVNYE